MPNKRIKSKARGKLYYYYFVVIFTFILIFFRPLGFILKLFKETRTHPWDIAGKIVLKILFFLARIKIRVQGKEDYEKTVIYASNHRGVIDGLSFNSVLHHEIFTMVAPVEHFPAPLRFWVKQKKSVRVFRTDEEEETLRGAISRREAIKESVSLLKKDYDLLIFPEGHVENNKHFLYFHTGAIRIALEANKNIIPCHIYHSDEIVEHDFKWVHPGEITIVFGKEWDLTKYYNQQENRKLVRDLTSELKEKVKKLHPDYKKFV